MLTFDFRPSDTGNEDFKAEGVDFRGDSFTVIGMVEPEADGVLRLEWKKLYPKGDIFYYSGTLVDEYTITGWLGHSVDYFEWQFVLKKIPAEHMIYRPRPRTLDLLPPPRPLRSVSISPYLHPRAASVDGGSETHLILDEHADETSDADKLKADGDAQTDSGPKTDTLSEPEDRTDDKGSVNPEAAASTDGRLTPDAGGSSAAGPSTSIEVLRRNLKYCALWQYAILAIRYDVRRKWWTWSYFASRRDARKKYLETHQILHGTFPYDSHHSFKVSEARLALTSQDARFYEALAIHLSKLQPYPLYVNFLHFTSYTVVTDKFYVEA